MAADYLIFLALKLEKQAIRIILGVGPRKSCRKLFTELGILSLPALYIAQVLIFFKRNPTYLDHTKPTHTYSTRNRDIYVLIKHKTSAFEKGTVYAGQLFFNKLPQQLRNLYSVDDFKNQLKKYLLSLNLYHVNEFVN